MDKLDTALHWLLEHDPQRNLYDSNAEYARAVGFETPSMEGTRRENEATFSDPDSIEKHHCRGCSSSNHVRSHTVA